MTQKEPKLSPLIHHQSLCKQKVKAKAELKLTAGVLKMYSRCKKNHFARVEHTDLGN
jgi:hypothetical protein